MPIIEVTITDEEFDAVAAGLPGDPATADARVREYLDGQLRSVVAQHVMNAKRRALEADGLPAKLADAGLDDDDVAAIKAARAAKRAALEAARG